MKLKQVYQLVRIAPDFFGSEKVIATYSTKHEADQIAKQRNKARKRKVNEPMYVVRKRSVR